MIFPLTLKAQNYLKNIDFFEIFTLLPLTTCLSVFLTLAKTLQHTGFST